MAWASDDVIGIPLDPDTNFGSSDGSDPSFARRRERQAQAVIVSAGTVALWAAMMSARLVVHAERWLQEEL